MKNKKRLGIQSSLVMTTSKREKHRERHGNLLPLGNGDFKDKKTRELRATPPLLCVVSGVANFYFFKKNE
jgi:hypothetical protein